MRAASSAWRLSGSAPVPGPSRCRTSSSRNSGLPSAPGQDPGAELVGQPPRPGQAVEQLAAVAVGQRPQGDGGEAVARLAPEAGPGHPAGPLVGHHGPRLGRLLEAGGRVQDHAGDLARVRARAGGGDHLAGADAGPDRHRRALQELEAGLEGAAGVVLVGRGDAEHGQDRATDQPLGGAAPGLQHLRHQPGAPVQLQPGLLRVDRARGGEDVKQDNGDELALLGRWVRGRGGSGQRRRLGGGEPPGRDVLVQPAGLGARLDAELLVQPGLELPVPAQRQVALPGERVGPDDGHDRLLAQRVGDGQPLEGGRGSVRVTGRLQLARVVEQPPGEAGVELIAPLHGPGLEPVLGQQVTAVQLDRRPEVAGLGGQLEGVDVDPEVGRLQAQHLVAQGQVLGGQRPAGEVDGLAEVGGGRLGGQVGPEHVHQLLAVQPLPAGQGQELDQRLGLVPAPGLLGHRRPVDRGPEASEEPDPELGTHCDRPPSRNPSNCRAPRPALSRTAWAAGERGGNGRGMAVA
jgi:hypothetical protein